MKKLIKGLVTIIIVGVALLYITDYNYILKGIRVVYLTGHTTAFIDDFKYFETETISASNNSQPWPKSKDYNTVAPTQKLSEIHKELETIAFLIIKYDSIHCARRAAPRAMI